MALLAAIPEMSRAELLEHWRTDHGRDAPKGISRRLLEYSAAYSAQVRAFGGLKPSTRRKLDRIAAKPLADRGKKPAPPPKRRLAPGTRLVREWHGRSHHVEVINTGFVYNGDIYRSLSEIAREITGARWSGPRFFGL
ncbi:MAG: DUF2924 domain-containing protein [Alphaproteobacteria bacterium]